MNIVSATDTPRWLNKTNKIITWKFHFHAPTSYPHLFDNLVPAQLLFPIQTFF